MIYDHKMVSPRRVCYHRDFDLDGNASGPASVRDGIANDYGTGGDTAGCASFRRVAHAEKRRPTEIWRRTQTAMGKLS